MATDYPLGLRPGRISGPLAEKHADLGRSARIAAAKIWRTAAVLFLGAVLAVAAVAFSRWYWYPNLAADHGWWAQRYVGLGFGRTTGKPSLERRTSFSDQKDVDFREQGFSLRLSGVITVWLPGLYGFELGSDDDSRLYIDGYGLIDNPGEHPLLTRNNTIWLGPGPHLIEVDYIQRAGQAGLSLAWQPPLRKARPLLPADLRPAAAPLSREQAYKLADRRLLGLVPVLGLCLWLLVMALTRIWLPRFDLFAALVGLSFLMLVTLWFNSGTLNPYAAISNKGPLLTPAKYPVNIDYEHHAAVHWMLDGDPVEKWSFSYTLRRIAFPLFAYPFIKAWEAFLLKGGGWGYLEGGILASWLLQFLALITWGSFLRRKFSRSVSLWGMALLATYPGLYFWAGIPWDYAWLVPGSLWCFMLICRLEEPQPAWRAALICLAIGALLTGYEIWPHFIPAALIMVLWITRKLWLTPRWRVFAYWPPTWR